MDSENSDTGEEGGRPTDVAALKERRFMEAENDSPIVFIDLD